MCEEAKAQVEKTELGKIVAETARIPWRDLEVFYAKGVAILVSADLDLIKVAHTLSIDDSTQVENWIESGQLLRLFDAEAKKWSDDGSDVWSVVVKPWVLVQPIASE